MLRAANSYLQTNVTTTNQADILIMLYDAGVKFLQQAKDFIDEKKVAEKGIAISKALDIIHELDSSLDMSQDTDFVQTSHQLYFFCSKQLLMANLKQDKERIDSVINILKQLRSAYKEIQNQPEVQEAAALAAARLPQNSSQTRVTTIQTTAHINTPMRRMQGHSNYGKSALSTEQHKTTQEQSLLSSAQPNSTVKADTSISTTALSARDAVIQAENTNASTAEDNVANTEVSTTELNTATSNINDQKSTSVVFAHKNFLRGNNSYKKSLLSN